MTHTDLNDNDKCKLVPPTAQQNLSTILPAKKTHTNEQGGKQPPSPAVANRWRSSRVPTDVLTSRELHNGGKIIPPDSSWPRPWQIIFCLFSLVQFIWQTHTIMLSLNILIPHLTDKRAYQRITNRGVTLCK
jgi:hypothetical protein